MATLGTQTLEQSLPSPPLSPPWPPACPLGIRGHHGAAGTRPMCQQGPCRPSSLVTTPCPGRPSVAFYTPSTQRANDGELGWQPEFSPESGPSLWLSRPSSLHGLQKGCIRRDITVLGVVSVPAAGLEPCQSVCPQGGGSAKAGSSASRGKPGAEKQ